MDLGKTNKAIEAMFEISQTLSDDCKNSADCETELKSIENQLIIADISIQEAGTDCSASVDCSQDIGNTLQGIKSTSDLVTETQAKCNDWTCNNCKCYSDNPMIYECCNNANMTDCYKHLEWGDKAEC